MIAQSVIDNFLSMQTDMNQQTQSLLVKFLDDRIQTAKKESTEADAKLAEYSRQNKIYSPDEQIKDAVGNMSLIDKAIADQQVAYQSAEAELAVVNAKIAEQKSGSLTYNVNDNDMVESIRSQIVAKEIELVGLEQKYTDKHPSVIAARQALSRLQQALTNEVRSVVDSQAATLNPTQSALMTQQAQASAKSAVASAARAALETEKSQQDSQMSELPETVMNYLQLKSDAEVKKGIYTNLVQQRENKVIQEAFESMDIQAVDEATLPSEDKPSVPRWKRIIFFGFCLGCLISLVYGAFLYRREA